MNRLVSFCAVLIVSMTALYSENIVEASAITAAFKKNELNANGTYKGNLYSVSGKVTAIEEDSSSKLPSMKLGEGAYSILFLFAREYMESISAVSVGDTVVIEALCTGTRRITGSSDKFIVFSEASMVSHSIAQSEPAAAKDNEPENPASVPEANSDKDGNAKAKTSSKLLPKSKDNEQVKEPEPDKNILQSIITVEGKKGVGTGFFTEFDGRKAVITNMHVLFENNGVKLLTINNTEIEPGEIFFAADRDIAIIFPKDQNLDIVPLKIYTDMDSIKNNSQVVVYGNSMGAGVNTEIFGKVSGVGPKTLEVSAKFVPGNSGSPILLKGSDQVIGVATSAAVYKADWTNAGTRFSDVRRFGTRIDNLKKSDLQGFKELDYKKDLILFNNMKDVCIAGYIIAASLKDGQPALISTEDFPESQAELLRMVKDWNLKGNSMGTSTKGRRIDAQTSGMEVSIDFFKNRFQRMKAQIQKSYADAKTLRPSYSYVTAMCDSCSEFMVGVVLKELDKIDDSLKELSDLQKKKANSSSAAGNSTRKH